MDGLMAICVCGVCVCVCVCVCVGKHLDADLWDVCERDRETAGRIALDGREGGGVGMK